MIRVRPIHHTADVSGWDSLLTALGAVRAVQNGSWSEYDTSSGTIAIRHTASSDPLAGQTLLGFTSTDLEAVRQAAADFGVRAVSTAEGTSEAVRVTTSSGFTFLIDIADRVPQRVPGTLAALQIWYQEDLVEVRQTLEGLGLVPRIVSNDPSRWADFTAAGGGLAAQHPGSRRRIELSFESGDDLDELASSLTAAGHFATVVDEAYNRSLSVIGPDGAEVVVNGAQDDLYGYRRIS